MSCGLIPKQHDDIMMSDSNPFGTHSSAAVNRLMRNGAQQRLSGAKSNDFSDDEYDDQELRDMLADNGSGKHDRSHVVRQPVVNYPRILIEFAHLISARGMRTYMDMSRVIIDASWSVSEDDVRCGRLQMKQSMELMIDAQSLDSASLGTNNGAGGGGKNGRAGLRQTPERWWQTFDDANLSWPFALNVSVVSYDCSQMPFDLQLSLNGIETYQERKMARPTPNDSILRDAVLRRFCTMGDATNDSNKGAGARKSNNMPIRQNNDADNAIALLTRPLVCTEQLTGVKFGSIEAIGFDEHEFWSDHAELFGWALAQESTHSPRTLSFGKKRANFSRGADPWAMGDARLGTRLERLFGGSRSRERAFHLRSIPTAHNFYRIKRNYQYGSLLHRVHVYLSVRTACKDTFYQLDFESIDVSLYQLPMDSEYVMWTAVSLRLAVQFVQHRLVDVHPSFHPAKLGVQIEPHPYRSWNDAWQMQVRESEIVEDVNQVNGVRVHNTRSPTNRNNGAGRGHAHNKTLKCSAKIAIWFAFVRRDRLPQAFTETIPNVGRAEVDAGADNDVYALDADENFRGHAHDDDEFVEHKRAQNSPTTSLDDPTDAGVVHPAPTTNEAGGKKVFKASDAMRPQNTVTGANNNNGSISHDEESDSKHFDSTTELLSGVRVDRNSNFNQPVRKANSTNDKPNQMELVWYDMLEPAAPEVESGGSNDYNENLAERFGETLHQPTSLVKSVSAPPGADQRYLEQFKPYPTLWEPGLHAKNTLRSPRKEHYDRVLKKQSDTCVTDVRAKPQRVRANSEPRRPSIDFSNFRGWTRKLTESTDCTSADASGSSQDNMQLVGDTYETFSAIVGHAKEQQSPPTDLNQQ